MKRLFSRQAWVVITVVAVLLAFATKAFSKTKKQKAQPAQKTCVVFPSPHYYIQR